MKNYWSGLPSSLRVGAHDMTVMVIPGWTSGSDNDYQAGQYTDSEHIFRFCAEAPSKSHATDTAIHEICHALLGPLGLEENEEERICSVLGGGMAQVLRDNPSLLTWLSDRNINGTTQRKQSSRRKPSAR